jgi:DNA invertase Pin-like site-specific DNA recombinase
MAVIGYARVSTRDQNLTAQIDALKAAGAGTIFREKVSGARADRPQLSKLVAGLKAGDGVVVTKLDRLGRSTRELLDLIDRIGKAGASFRSLGDPLWDTSSAQGRLLSTLLASIAEFERELIRERTGEGRKRAMAAGVKFGRKRKLSDYQRAAEWIAETMRWLNCTTAHASSLAPTIPAAWRCSPRSGGRNLLSGH